MNLDFIVSPNPAKNQINLFFIEKFSDLEFEYTIFTNLGEKIQSGKAIVKNSKIELNKFENGIYYIQLRANNSFATQKFVITK